ncbi:c-type cytochrome [Phytohalomonas tamaricis]|uniref:c-type cytochrome n=1 Tax=Phytohalomonas tamaricis TaxID=2081032 RepID=UPI00131A4008|nr:c-type cytochrome [Phytohalomonas tamaricis]
MDNITKLLGVTLLFATGLAAQASAAELPAQNADHQALGKKIYEQTCAGCHNVGVMNSPRFGDKRTLSALENKSIETLYTHTIEGYRGMPPKGGDPSLSEKEVKAAVDYLVHSAD